MTKKIITLLAASFFAASAMVAGTGPVVTSIEPPYWWTGMANDTLQLFIYGNDVKDADISVNYPGVKVASIADLDGSDDYKVVY